jgi:hypothetical protein
MAKRKKSPDQWHRRIKGSRELRDRMRSKVWQPLHDAFVGNLCLLQGVRPESINPFAQFVEVVLPQILYDEPEALVQPVKVSPGIDPQMAIQFAELLQQQATAVGRATHLVDELQTVLFDFIWGCGIVLFGFNPPAGIAPDVPGGEGDQSQDESWNVDMDFAASGHREFIDAGMPYCRAVSPMRFLGDPTHNRFEQGHWCAIEYYLTIAEFRARYPQHKDAVRATHDGEPVELQSGDDDSVDATDVVGERAAQKVVCMIDVYTRVGEKFTLPDEKTGIREILEEQPLELGIEGLPIEILGRQWGRHNPYPIPPMASWYGSGTDEQVFLDSVIDQSTQVRSVMLVNEGQDENLAETIRNSENQGVIPVKGNPEGRIKGYDVGTIRRDHVAAYQLVREATELGSGISEFQRGVRQKGEMSATEASALQAATSVRLETLRGPALRLVAKCYKNLMAICYQKIDLMAGIQFPMGDQLELKFASIDPNRPVVGEILDYHFDVGAAEVAQLSQSQLQKAQQETLELALNPNVQQALAMEGMTISVATVLQNRFKQLRNKAVALALRPLPPPPPQQPVEEGPPPAQAGPPSAPPPGGPPAGGPPPEEGGPPPDPLAEYQQLVTALAQLPEGDPNEAALIDRLGQLRVELSGQAQPA